MHEQSIAQAIIEEAQKHGVVKKIIVECGDLGHLPAIEMKSVLEKITPWEIEVIQKKAVVKCEKCSFVGEPNILQQLHDQNVFACPKCEEMFPEILEGGDILLKEVSVDE